MNPDAIFPTPLPEVDDLSAPLAERALQNLRSNVARGYDPYYRVRYAYVRPSPGRYNWQWFWDSCFHVIALSKLDTTMAEQELRMILTAQDPDGFIGHMTYWGRQGAVASGLFMQSRFGTWRRRHSSLIQPPVLAQALERLYEATSDSRILARYLPAVRRYYDWLHEHRTPPESSLIAIFSPYEAGVDNSPAYDPLFNTERPGRRRILYLNRRLDFLNLFAARNYNERVLFSKGRFVVLDTLVNAVYADALRSTARLHEALGQTAEATEIDRRALAVEGEINERLWYEEGGYYTHLAGRDAVRLTTLTASSLLPVILPSTPADRVRRVLEDHILNESEFWTPLPVPSVAASEPTFDPSGERMIWRGPVCMNLNWMLVRGLRHHGFRDVADEITRRSRRTVADQGFREFYNPLTGAGLRGTDFGWATIVVDM